MSDETPIATYRKETWSAVDTLQRDARQAEAQRIHGTAIAKLVTITELLARSIQRLEVGDHASQDIDPRVDRRLRDLGLLDPDFPAEAVSIIPSGSHFLEPAGWRETMRDAASLFREYERHHDGQASTLRKQHRMASDQMPLYEQSIAKRNRNRAIAERIEALLNPSSRGLTGKRADFEIVDDLDADDPIMTLDELISELRKRVQSPMSIYSNSSEVFEQAADELTRLKHGEPAPRAVVPEALIHGRADLMTAIEQVGTKARNFEADTAIARVDLEMWLSDVVAPLLDRLGAYLVGQDQRMADIALDRDSMTEEVEQARVDVRAAEQKWQIEREGFAKSVASLDWVQDEFNANAIPAEYAGSQRGEAAKWLVNDLRTRLEGQEIMYRTLEKACGLYSPESAVVAAHIVASAPMSTDPLTLVDKVAAALGLTKREAE